MSRWFRSLTVGCSLLALASASVSAATWTPIGTSGFTAPGKNFDSKRINLNYIIEDANGVIYATAACANNTGSTVGTDAGGLSIYTPAGGGSYSRQDVDVAAAGVPGEITKMVIGGDGYVYGLQNWVEVVAPNTGKLNNRILKIAPNGTLTIMYDVPITADTTAPAKLVDIATASDGNIYITRNAADSNYKYHYLYRLRLFGTGAPIVEESPLNSLGVNQGRSETHFMYDLQYVGTTNGIDSLSIWSNQSGGNKWETTGMGWERINTDVSNYQYNRKWTTFGFDDAGWGRGVVTASAYDPIRKKLWYAGQAATSSCLWKYDFSGTKGTEFNYGIYDIGSGNMGLFYRRSGNATKSCYSVRSFLNGGFGQITFAGRFRVDSFDPTYDGYFMTTAASPWAAATGGDTNTVIGVRISGGQFWLYNVTANTQLAALGTADNAFHEIRLFANSQTDTASCTFDGVEKFNGAVVTSGVAWDGALLSFGAAAAGRAPTNGLAASATFDWVAATGQQTGGGMYTGPADATWPVIAGGGNEGSLFQGDALPSDWLSTSIMERFNGNPVLPSLFDGIGVPGSNPDPLAGIGSAAKWHVNGNDPQSSRQTNGALYWVSALGINPCSGRAWMAVSAPRIFGCCPLPDAGMTHQWYNQNSNTYAQLGQFITVGADDGGPTGTVNGPGTAANSEIVGVYFSQLTRKVYALSYDLTAGTYLLASTPNPESDQCCPIPWADTDADQDVDMVDFAKMQSCLSTGPGIAGNNLAGPGCSCFDTNYDKEVDGTDVNEFILCSQGPGVPSPCN